jgi:hypothetical protein
MATDTATMSLTTPDLIEQPSLADDATDDLLEKLREHLADIPDVAAVPKEADSCAARGCRRGDCPHWIIDVRDRRSRTLCPTHAVDFTQKESRYDV